MPYKDYLNFGLLPTVAKRKSLNMNAMKISQEKRLILTDRSNFLIDSLSPGILIYGYFPCTKRMRTQEITCIDCFKTEILDERITDHSQKFD